MNRALQGQYPPGSTYKVVTAIGGLEEKLDRRAHRRALRRLVPARAAHVPLLEEGRPRRRRSAQGAGPVVRRVLLQASGLELGVNRLAYYARALGLGARTGIELGGEMPGLVPTKEWRQLRDGTPWVDGDTVSVSIGQGANLWTPLQLASAYAAIANGGTRYKTHILKRIEEPDGTIVRTVEPEVGGRRGRLGRDARARARGARRRRQRAARHGRRHAQPARRRARGGQDRHRAGRRHGRGRAHRHRGSGATSTATTPGSSPTRRPTIRGSSSPC